MALRQADLRDSEKGKAWGSTSLAKLATTAAYRDTLRKIQEERITSSFLPTVPGGSLEGTLSQGNEDSQGLRWLTR
ncbi:hypothetical protein AAY473_007287 [Plecturocebus cupreus]